MKRLNNTICDRSLLNKTISLPLSVLTEELQILKLDDSDEALVKETSVEISDNYLLVKGSQQIPFKLFDRKTGKFITNIGAFGQGPNEYQNVYDQQLDEKNNRIYLLPWQTKKILVYAFSGNYFAQNIDPGNLQDQLTKAVETNKQMSPGMRSKLTKLRDSIDENDNNYVLYAKVISGL
jgi:hypothetical protein